MGAWMWQEKSTSEPGDEQPSVPHTFRHVYDFILRAVQGDTVAASALFQRYLGGELPEELLALSRRWVQTDREVPNAPQNCTALPLKKVLRKPPAVEVVY